MKRAYSDDDDEKSLSVSVDESHEEHTPTPPPQVTFPHALILEQKVEPSTFHLWNDLLPEMANTVIDLTDFVTHRCLSMTCTKYKQTLYTPPWK